MSAPISHSVAAGDADGGLADAAGGLLPVGVVAGVRVAAGAPPHAVDLLPLRAGVYRVAAVGGEGAACEPLFVRVE